MCRYAFSTYKPHYACFDCRKTFKRRLLSDIQEGYSMKQEEHPAKCPQCGQFMADMGKDFEAPKKDDVKAWKHMATLYEAGIAFHSCGCTGPGYIPRDNAEIIKYLERVRSMYLYHQHFWSRRGEVPKGQSAKDKDKFENGRFLISIPGNLKGGTRKNPTYDVEGALAYWVEKIKAIDTKIETVKRL